MKATGIIRKVDELGRVVIPMELRKTMGLDAGAPMEVLTSENGIVLRKYEPGCMFCGEAEGLQSFKGKAVCSKCIDELGKDQA